MSDPRVKIDTAGTHPRTTLLANRLAREIGGLTEDEVDAVLAVLDVGSGKSAAARQRRRPET